MHRFPAGAIRGILELLSEGLESGMAGSGGICALRRAAGLLGLIAGGLLLANCSGGNMAGRVDPRYGVASSARVVQPGEPVPKGGGVYRVGKPYTVAGRVYTPPKTPNTAPSGSPPGTATTSMAAIPPTAKSST